jgi:hypothetical protein
VRKQVRRGEDLEEGGGVRALCTRKWAQQCISAITWGCGCLPQSPGVGCGRQREQEEATDDGGLGATPHRVEWTVW